MARKTEAELLKVIEGLYTASTEATYWPTALQEMSEFLDGSAVFYFGGSIDPQCQPDWHYSFGLPKLEEYQDYLDYYYQVDIRLQYALNSRPLQSFIDQNFISEQDMPKHIFYDYLKQGFDFKYCLAALLEKTSKTYSSLGVHRAPSRGAFDEKDMRVMDLLTMHFSRAHSISAKLASANAIQSSLSDTLELVNIGVVMLNYQGNVVHANDVANKIFSARDGIGLFQKELFASFPEANKKIRNLISSALTYRQSPSNAAGGFAAIPRPSGKRSYAITVSPTNTSKQLDMPWAVATVLIVDAEQVTALDPQRIAEFLELTATEAELVHALILGQSVTDYARTASVSPHTARWHLKQVMSKTNTTRQVDLVQLVMRGLSTLP